MRDRSFVASDRQHCIGHATWCDNPEGRPVGFWFRHFAMTGLEFVRVSCREDRRRMAVERRAAGVVAALSSGWFDNDRAAMHGFSHLVGWQRKIEEIS
jgi:hypothetical protein